MKTTINFQRLFSSFLLSCLFLFLSACAMVGPEYNKPDAPLQKEWTVDEEEEKIRQKTMSDVPDAWWQDAFNDQILNALIEEALAENLTLRSAGLKVLQARQILAIAVGSQYPQEQQFSGKAALTGLTSSSAYGLYNLGFNLSWEADIWGRFSRQVQSAAASLDAGIAGYDGVTVSLIAAVADTYIQIKTAQERLDVAKENLALQKESVRITREKADIGEVSSLDLDQAQTLYHNTMASVTGLEVLVAQLHNSLAVLLGNPPGKQKNIIALDANSNKAISIAEPGLIIGLPQDMIRRRPDIRVAERLLAAQSAQIGFAITELYPHFGIGGSIGPSISTQGSGKFSDLFDVDNFGYSLFGFFKWNIFNYGRLKNNVRLQDAIFQQHLEDYRQTVLLAQSEVENAIIAYIKLGQQLSAYNQAANAAKRAVEVASTQYQGGLIEFDTVINTLKAQAAQQDQLAAARGSLAVSLVNVYKSLGVGKRNMEGSDPLDMVAKPSEKEMLERGDYWQDTFEQ